MIGTLGELDVDTVVVGHDAPQAKLAPIGQLKDELARLD